MTAMPNYRKTDTLSEILNKSYQLLLLNDGPCFRDGTFYSFKFFEARISLTKHPGKVFHNCNFQDCTISGNSKEIFFEECVFTNCRFSGPHFKLFSFSGCSFNDCDFNFNSIRDSKFLKSFFIKCFIKCSFTFIESSGTTFKECKFGRTSFSSSSLNDTNFIYSEINELYFNDSILSDSSIAQCKFLNIFSEATSFQNISVIDNFFDSIDILATDFSNCTLHNNEIDYIMSRRCTANESEISNNTARDYSFSKNIIDNDTYTSLSPQTKISPLEVELLGLEPGREKIVRKIEFPPEYCQAGISILNYFGTILEKKHNDKETKFSIEQQGCKVTMTIEANDGTKEEIEHSLEDYGLVVIGNKPLETIFENPYDQLELKGHLRLVQAQLENTREINALQQKEIASNRDIITTLVETINNISGSRSPATPISIDFKPRINIIQKSKSNVNKEMLSNFNELSQAISSLPSSNTSEAAEKSNIAHNLLNIEASTEHEEVTGILDHCENILRKAQDPHSSLGKIIHSVENGIETVQKAAGIYNKIAKWFNLPQVPGINS